MLNTEELLSDRIKSAPESFIRKILKISIQSNIISFSGGHPNAGLFPVKEIEEATNKVLHQSPHQTLQYSSTEGDLELRQWIANRYKKTQGKAVSVDDILITNGSQQALDILSKVILNDGDPIAIENPGYLGAIQAFSLYQPKMHPVDIDHQGMNINQLKEVLAAYSPKLIYTVPNFQNPTGISYSQANRESVAKEISGLNVMLIQDDPYGDLRFEGEIKDSFYDLLPDQTLLLGSFSKIVVPSLRLGWIVAPQWLMKPLIIAKQASDLHTNYFSQRVMIQYLKDNSLDLHIESLVKFYCSQKNAMIGAIEKHFPAEVSFENSEGGMFLWVKLPERLSAMRLFDESIKENVAFVPGEPFYIKGSEQKNTLRLSYVTANKEEIEQGIKVLGRCIKRLL